MRVAVFLVLATAACGAASELTVPEDAGQPVPVDAGLACSGGTTKCGARCVDLAVDPSNCGACGKLCGGSHAVGTCTEGTCSLTCVGSFQDCDKNPANGCEVDVSSDPKSCGRCGHDCLGGACVNNRCQPVVLSPSEGNVAGIAVDATRVYWTSYSNGLVRSCPKTGCSGGATTLASGQQEPFGIAADGTNVYWTETTGSAVRKCAAGGCGGNPSTLASGQQNPFGIATDGVFVYWTNNAGGEVRKCATGGCSGNPTLLATVTNPAYVVVDKTGLYWTSGNSVRRCSTSCANDSVLLANSGFVNQVATDGTNVYWGGSALYACAVNGCGGFPTIVTPGNFPFGVVVDATDIYYSTPGLSSIWKCPKGDCSGGPTVVSAAQSSPGQLAQDATAIYWGNYAGGAVVKIAKRVGANQPVS